MKKVLSILFVLTMLVSAVSALPVVAAELTVDAGVDYTESTETVVNPHMGYPAVAGDYLKVEGNVPRNDSGFMFYYYNLARFSGANSALPDDVQWDREDAPLSEDALSFLRKTLENLRANGGSCFFRFVYDFDGNKGREPSSFDTVLTHVKQFCEVISDFEDVCLGFECGIIGVHGEMHNSIYDNPKYINPLIDTYLDNTPDSMTLMVRQPRFIADYMGISRNQLAKTVVAKGSRLSRLSYYNDGYMNTDIDTGTWANRALEIQFLSRQSEHNPYGGEFGSEYRLLPNTACLPENAIPEMYKTHLSYIRGNIYHSSNGYFGYDSYTYGPEYEKEWYPDNSAFYGVDCRSFIRSHLGYRLVLRESKLSVSSKAGGKLEINGKIENTGFGNVIHDPKVQIVLLYKAKSYVIDTDIDAFDFKSCKTTDYSVTLDLPEELEAGEYKVYMRMSHVTDSEATSVKSGIKFANNGNIYNIYYGANYLGSVTVNGYSDNVLGDANCDGSVNVLDLTYGAQFISGGDFDLSSCDLYALDIDGDEDLDQKDLNAITAIIKNN